MGKVINVVPTVMIVCPACSEKLDARRKKCSCGNLVTGFCKIHNIYYDLNICPVCPICDPKALEALGMLMCKPPSPGGVFTKACVMRQKGKPSVDPAHPCLCVPASRFNF
jgi:hypothetical protein